jgi:predicted DNA-binding protein (MmcQ/YjbR family)
MPTRATAAPSAHPIHPLAPKDRRLVDRLRAICLALPDANERVSHGEATWFAGRGKSFAMTDNHHHGSTHLSVWLPQPPDIQASLIESDPARFFRPPYVGPRGWVGVVLDTGPDWDMVRTLVTEAYRHVAGKKLLARLGS